MTGFVVSSDRDRRDAGTNYCKFLKYLQINNMLTRSISMSVVDTFLFMPPTSSSIFITIVIIDVIIIITTTTFVMLEPEWMPPEP